MSNLDDPQTTIDRINILNSKPFLRNVYLDFYNLIREKIKSAPKGNILELGSGAGFSKEVIPETITSDIMKLDNCNLVANAEKLPFRKSQLSVIYMLNVFHHINDPLEALKEFSRTLKKGGRVVMIEPSNTFLGRFINQNFHHESFDPGAGWELKQKGPLSGGNGAAAWIVFRRDVKKFNKLFPEFRIIEYKSHTPLKYIFSGGFMKPSLLPTSFYPLVIYIERLLSPLNDYLGLFVTVVLEKK